MSSTRIRFKGNIGIGDDPSAMLDINSDIIRLRTAKTPASAGASGNAGDICWDASNNYLATATNTWQYVPRVNWTTAVWDAGANDFYISSDAKRLKLGAGQDMAIGYDGTDGVIDSSLVGASDIAITCGANKTIELQNVVYDDIRINPGSFDRPGVSDPALVAYDVNGGGVNTYLYEFDKNDIASFTVQIPHSYKEGQDVKVHIHWTPGANGATESGNTVGWKIDYSWANIDGNFGTMATLDLSDACDGTNHKHQMTPDITITGTSKAVSSMLVCNVKRTDTGTDDTWAGTAAGALPMLLEIDIHFPIDTIGSRDWGTK